MALQRFDAIVVGFGQAGKPVALDLGGAGRRNAATEWEHAGVPCVGVGRTPTKSMVGSAHVALLTRRAADVGKTASPVCTARGLQRGSAIVTTSANADDNRESVEVSPVLHSAMEETKRIATCYRFSRVVETAIQRFIPRRR
jgi:pyruvate/2-oxoglutarate dehydrogenase complex dihydrolipoamide dehydrogenase (E3) component